MKSKSTVMRVLLASLVPVATLLLALGSPAGAHTGEQSYVYLDILEDRIEGRVEFPIDQLNDVLDLSIPQGRDGALRGIAENLELLQDYAGDHLAIGDGTVDWGLDFDGFDMLFVNAGSYAILEFEVVERFDSVPRQFTVFFDGIIESNPDADAFLLIANDWGTGTFANEADDLLRYTSGNTTQVVDLDDSSWWKGMSAVIDLGIDHIRIGTDHILFVIALVLPAVLVFNREDGWQPAPTFGSSLWRVMKIVTMFTIAHSITLTLGGFEIIELPARGVEFLIAISIALAALHNLKPRFFNKEWAIAFGFGLFHGLGFAGLLSDLGLDRSNRIQSLLGFNLGIEIGQAVIILLLFPVLFILRRTLAYTWIFTLGSIALAVVATGWAFERLFETDVGVNDLIDPVFAWPRAFWVMIVAAMAATALYAFEDRRRRLRPLPATAVAEDPDDDEVLVEV